MALTKRELIEFLNELTELVEGVFQRKYKNRLSRK